MDRKTLEKVIDDVKLFYLFLQLQGIDGGDEIVSTADDFFCKTHQKWFEWFLRGVDFRKGRQVRQLFAYRGSGKSSIMQIALARMLLNFPNLRVAVVRESIQNASATLGSVARLMDTEGYRLLYSMSTGKEIKKVWQIDNESRKVSTARDDISITEGTLEAFSIEKRVTGRHYDVILFDDFVSLDDQQYKTRRDRKYLNLKEFFNNILSPNGIAYCLGTFWHERDAMQLMAKHWAEGKKKGYYEYERLDYPIGSVRNESPDRLSDIIAGLKSTLSLREYHANYLLQGYQGDELPFAKINPYMKGDFGRGEIFASLDCAYGGEDGTALSIVKKFDKGIGVIGYLWEGESVYGLIEKICNILVAVRVKYFYVEETTGTQLEKTFEGKLKEMRVRSRFRVIKGFKQHQNKTVRIYAQLKPFWDKIYMHPATNKGYIHEVTEWSETAGHDDAVDSLAQAITFCVSNERK